MSAIPYDAPEHDVEAPEQESFAPPGRPRRRFFNRKSAALAAIITCAAGFYAGVRVEKGQLSSTASAATSSAAGAATGARTGAGSGAFAGRFGGGAGGAGGGGNASIGTISSVSGNTIYLTDSSGNTVKVTLSSSTKLTKSLGVSKSSLHPGDAIVVQGVKNSGGALVATSVSDQGARPTSGSGTAGRGSASASSTTGGSTAGG
jgi:hypothetical protein